MRALIPALLAAILLAPAAWAQTQVSIASLPTIHPAGLSAHLQSLISVPAESATAPTARINYMQQLTDGSGRYFVNDINGTLYTAPSSGGIATPYLNIATANVGATDGGSIIGPGFSGFAFHPNFGKNPALTGYDTFYASTNIANTNQATTLGSGVGPNVIEIREWTALNPAASTFAGTSRVVLSISGYADAHSSASIAFNGTALPGSADYGNLYIASGDGLYNDGNQNAQNLASPQGKLLRINPLAGPNGQPYTVPADNPFVGQSGKLAEVWAYGLRFPQTFGWDSQTGTMYINDLGQAALEEVDIGQAGANYGWSQREGTYATGYAFGLGDENIYQVPPGGDTLGYVDPIAQYSHLDGNALGSGFLYRGSKLPSLYGMYVMQDIVNGRIFYFDPAAATPGTTAPIYELSLTQNGQPFDLNGTYGYPNPFDLGNRLDARLQLDASGELAMALKANGQIYDLVQDVPEPATLALLAPLLLLRRRSSTVRHPRA